MGPCSVRDNGCSVGPGWCPVDTSQIYANCVHRPNANYQSVGELLMDGPGMGRDVHILYGPGKDLGIPGWKVTLKAGGCRTAISDYG